jgi:hypothetical protein
MTTFGASKFDCLGLRRKDFCADIAWDAATDGHHDFTANADVSQLMGIAL